MEHYILLDRVLTSNCTEHRAALFCVQADVVDEVAIDGAEARLRAETPIYPLC